MPDWGKKNQALPTGRVIFVKDSNGDFIPVAANTAGQIVEATLTALGLASTTLSDTVNLHNRVGLIAGVVVHGRQDGATVSPVSAVTPTDAAGLNSLVGICAVAEQMNYNDTTWDKARNNYEVTVLASSARAATTNSSDQTNYNARGAHVVLNTTTAGTTTITLTIQGKATASTSYYTILASSAVSGTATVVFRVYPGLTAAASATVNDVLPRIWRVTVSPTDTTNVTYSVSANYIV